MVQINFAQKSVTVKIVYYGPGMSGKTTNLEIVHQRAPETSRGDLTSISTDGDRTLFFDFMPLDLGTVAGMRTQFQIYTVPGQVYYNSTRKLVLQGVDGVIFIADSSASMMEENLESMRNLEENLAEYGKDVETLPIVIQYNKRDLPDALPVEQLQQALNPRNAPYFEGMANTGQGVFPTLKALAALVLDSIHEQTGTGGGGPQSQSAPIPPPPASAAAAPAPPAPMPAATQPPIPASPPPAPQPAAASAPQPAAQEPPAATPASPPVTQAATGFYPAPGAAPAPPAPVASPPVPAASTGFYPAPGAPQVTPAPEAPSAPPMQNIPVAAPQQAAGAGMPQGFPQPGSAPGFPGGPDQLQQTGFHAAPQQGQPGAPGQQYADPSQQHLRIVPQGAGMQEHAHAAPMGAPAPGRAMPQQHQQQVPQQAPQQHVQQQHVQQHPQPLPQQLAHQQHPQHQQHQQAVAPAQGNPAAPSPRIKPRTSALPTPNAGDKKSAMVTAVFVIVALGVGIAIGGFAFGLF